MKLLPLIAAAAALFSACQSAPKHGDFTVKNQIVVDVPPGASNLRMWMALPQNDPHQQVSGLRIDCPYPNRISGDSEGNRLLYIEADSPKEGKFTVATTFDLTRSEQRAEIKPQRTRPLNDEERARFAKELSGNANVVISQEVRDLAARTLAGETNPVLASQKLYDWTLKNIDYWVKSPADRKASAVGSSEYCLSSKTGNCTDFHSLYAALSRASGIPTRILYGSFLKQELDGQDVDQSYHCWIEFWAPELGWIPLDVAVADIFVGDFNVTEANAEMVRRTTAAGYSGPDPALVQYYFGNLEERRVLWSVGRDLELDPKPAAGAVNALPKAYVEIDGKPAAEKSAWTRKLTYRQLQ
ncbi:MAG: transglutaminase domain-containing protein [Planctomycetes bacterium]|jgi:transglutaminase-like putative cysteine protease|nr:transglutaminase domain-containing protein [Planctomycetota bacterium]